MIVNFWFFSNPHLTISKKLRSTINFLRTGSLLKERESVTGCVLPISKNPLHCNELRIFLIPNFSISNLHTFLNWKIWRTFSAESHGQWQDIWSFWWTENKISSWNACKTTVKTVKKLIHSLDHWSLRKETRGGGKQSRN